MFTLEEMQVKQLLESVITRHISGSATSRTAMRNEIQGLMMEYGCPSFYITINLADVYNPIVKFMGGDDIDLDNLLTDNIPNFSKQS